jgi:hypothetical protein
LKYSSNDRSSSRIRDIAPEPDSTQTKKAAIEDGRPLRQTFDRSLEKDDGCARHLEEAEAAKNQRASYEQSDCRDAGRR